MNFKFAKAGCKVNVLLCRHRLITKENDLVFVECLPNVIDDGLGEIGGQIDSTDLGAYRRSESLDVKVIPGQLGKAGPLVSEVQNWADSFATKGLAIFGDVRTRVFDGDDVGVSSSRLHKSPLGSEFLTGRQKLYPKRVPGFAGLGPCRFGEPDEAQ